MRFATTTLTTALAAVVTLVGCGGGPDYCVPCLQSTCTAPHPNTCQCPPADLAGTPLQICGRADAFYSESICACYGVGSK
jgi:hypothetical protein